jgi:hypothetical protein
MKGSSLFLLLSMGSLPLENKSDETARNVCTG